MEEDGRSIRDNVMSVCSNVQMHLPSHTSHLFRSARTVARRSEGSQRLRSHTFRVTARAPWFTSIVVRTGQHPIHPFFHDYLVANSRALLFHSILFTRSLPSFPSASALAPTAISTPILLLRLCLLSVHSSPFITNNPLILTPPASHVPLPSHTSRHCPNLSKFFLVPYFSSIQDQSIGHRVP